MRLLITTDTVGGVWTFTRELTEGLLQAGHSVHLVSFGRLPSVDQAGWTARVAGCRPDRFQFHATAFPLEWMQNNDHFFPESAALLTRIANSFGADLVHSNQLCYGDLRCGLPVLVTVHSDVRSWSLACRGALPDSSPWMERYDRLVERGLRAARAIVAPTAWMLAEILRHYGPLNRTAVIPNGRSLADPAEPSTRLLQAATVGRLWDEAKDLRLLGSVMSPMPLLVAGETHGPETAGLAPVPGVRMLGSLSETGVLDLFRRSAVYIVPSTFEPFGLAPLEAALCGCAIVARDIASLHEVWGDAAVYFRDAGELSALLTVLHADAPGLRNLQARARTRAIERYGRDRMTQLYLVQYRAAIAASRADRIGKLDVA